VLNLIQEIGMTFLFSTHDQEVGDRAKRNIVLEDGINVREETRDWKKHRKAPSPGAGLA
jgi:ABC-type lipoprotein export system ATPase subunit